MVKKELPPSYPPPFASLHRFEHRVRTRYVQPRVHSQLQPQPPRSLSGGGTAAGKKSVAEIELELLEGLSHAPRQVVEGQSGHLEVVVDDVAQVRLHRQTFLALLDSVADPSLRSLLARIHAAYDPCLLRELSRNSQGNPTEGGAAKVERKPAASALAAVAAPKLSKFVAAKLSRPLTATTTTTTTTTVVESDSHPPQRLTLTHVPIRRRVRDEVAAAAWDEDSSEGWGSHSSSSSPGSSRKEGVLCMPAPPAGSDEHHFAGVGPCQSYSGAVDYGVDLG